MSRTNLQFSVAAHVMVSLGARYGEEVCSSDLAGSINANPSFVRRVLSKLAKAGLVSTTRGKNGCCSLSRSPKEITLLDIYKASEAPAAFTIHSYPVTASCQVSRNIKGSLSGALLKAQQGFERGLVRQTLADLVRDVTRH